jgi:hypothetical protein
MASLRNLAGGAARAAVELRHAATKISLRIIGILL